MNKEIKTFPANIELLTKQFSEQIEKYAKRTEIENFVCDVYSNMTRIGNELTPTHVYKARFTRVTLPLQRHSIPDIIVIVNEAETLALLPKKEKQPEKQSEKLKIE